MIEITINGIDELVKKLNTMDVKAGLNKAIRKSVFTLEREVKQIRPPRVITGLLRNSFETIFGDLEGKLNNFRDYAPFVDARTDFMRKGLDASEDQIINIFNEEVETLLKTL